VLLIALAAEHVEFKEETSENQAFSALFAKKTG